MIGFGGSMPATVSVGTIASGDEMAWNRLVRQFGSGFQTVGFCRAFELHWSGRSWPRHVTVREGDELTAVIPAYLYGSCNRVDFYRRCCPGYEIHDPILMSHAMVAWYGYPVAANRGARELVVRAFARAAAQDGAIAMFAGIDGRDEDTLRVLREQGFAIGRIQTLMRRDVRSTDAEDPTVVLPGKSRSRIRNQLSLARRSGVTVRLATSRDYPIAADMVTSILRQLGTPVEALPTAFVRAVIEGQVPGVETLAAVDPQDRLVGVQIGVHFGSTYLIWLAGHDRATLQQYHQSHLLYNSSIQRASILGCTEVQAGRNTFDIKRQHGFTPVPLYCAVHSADAAQQQRAAAWVSALEERHYTIFPAFRPDSAMI